MAVGRGREAFARRSPNAVLAYAQTPGRSLPSHTHGTQACVASAEQDCGRYATQLCENSHPSRLWID